MSGRVTKVFRRIDFAIWHVPQANGYVYGQPASRSAKCRQYHDCPFEDSYDNATNAACGSSAMWNPEP